MKRFLRILYISLLTAATLGTAAFALEVPDAWAADAAQFAAAQQLVSAEALRPHDGATRGELATVLTRLFRATQKAESCAAMDVNPTDWYFDAMANAVSMGVYQITNGRLQPNAPLSREQAMTALARTFGLAEGERASLKIYADASEISPWAASSVAALTRSGAVTGSGGKLNPHKTITRQELLVLLQKLCGTVVSDGVLPETGNVLWVGAEPPRNLTVRGDLYLGCGYEGEVTLQNVTVEGCLVLHSPAVTLTGATRAKEIVACAEKLTLKGNSAQALRVIGGKTILTGGSWQTAQIFGGELTVEAGASVSNAVLAAKNSAVTGTGTVRQGTILQKDCKIETADTRVEEKIDAGVARVRITAPAPANEAKPAAPTIATTVQFTNVDVTNCYGAEENVRLCTLLWYVDGVLAEKTEDFPLTEGGTVSFKTTANYSGKQTEKTNIRVELRYGDELAKLTQTVRKHLELLPSPVKTLRVEATTRRATTLYAGSGLTGWICNLPAGTKGIYDGYSGTRAGRLRLADGRMGWVRWYDLEISNKNYVETTDYSKGEKENFVNQKTYKSPTDYLVWVSLLKQKVNIFSGKQGQWSLIHAYSCTSGKNTTPTIAGVFSYAYRNNNWDFGSYYVNKPMVFNGGHAFHTRTYIKSGGGLLDATMGRPASHGCIRMEDAPVNWMWDNIPFRTTVVVY